MIKLIRKFLCSQKATCSTGVLVTGGIITGIIFLGVFNTAVEATNTEEFCISCHEMKNTVYQEYKTSVHYTNHSGVRVSCSDCHVPKTWVNKMKRKVEAASEVYHALAGTIDTKEKFEKHRLELARRVWKVMKETDSRECRSCHQFDFMAFNDQDKTARKKHQSAQVDGKTCIDCHKGIAHELPEEEDKPS